MSLVLVTWRDARSSLEDDDFEDYLVQTVGWIVEKGDLFLKLAAERLPGDDYRGFTWIPNECVVAIYDAALVPSVMLFAGFET